MILQTTVFKENFFTRVYRFPGLSRTCINFPGLSRTFQDFKDPYEPCTSQKPILPATGIPAVIKRLKFMDFERRVTAN